MDNHKKNPQKQIKAKQIQIPCEIKDYITVKDPTWEMKAVSAILFFNNHVIQWFSMESQRTPRWIFGDIWHPYRALSKVFRCDIRDQSAIPSSITNRPNFRVDFCL